MSSFFQAEDGIRDGHVTGVQTCALPILQQQEKDARRRSRQQEMKAIKFRVKIENHDFQTKVNHIKRFLKDGHKVRVVIMFRGRERAHPELGKQILDRVAKELAGIAVVDSPPSIAGMDMNMTLRPASD